MRCIFALRFYVYITKERLCLPFLDSAFYKKFFSKELYLDIDLNIAEFITGCEMNLFQSVSWPSSKLLQRERNKGI